MKDVRDALMVAHTSDGKLVRRPLSPHLQVYRLPFTAGILSILSRITSVALSVGTLLMTWWLLAAAAGPASYDTVRWFVGSPVGLVLLFGWTAALFYHLFAGIRHLVWDAGYGYDLNTSRMSGYATVIATGVFTALVWLIGIIVG